VFSLKAMGNMLVYSLDTNILFSKTCESLFFFFATDYVIRSSQIVIKSDTGIWLLCLFWYFCCSSFDKGLNVAVFQT